MRAEKGGRENRRHSRKVAKDGVFLTLRPDFSKMGRLVDISQGGIAFEYILLDRGSKALDVTAPARVNVEVDIFTSSKQFHLSKVPCDIVYDDQLEDLSNLFTVETRRCGLRFKSLSYHQSAKLAVLMKDYTFSSVQSLEQSHELLHNS